MKDAKLIVVEKPQQLLTDREIFRLGTRLTDAMHKGAFFYRSQVDKFGGKEMYPGGRVMLVEQHSENFSVEASLMFVGKNSYRVTYVLLEARR